MPSDQIKISIIMPVYNVEKYLRRAVDSITSQNFDDFELFLVDDGSTDSSGKICDDYDKLDKRIKVIHQENAGAHTARNNAIEKAKGKYVFFFDSDDYIENGMLADMYKLASDNDSDVVVSGFYIDTYYDDKNYVTLDYIPYTSNGKNIETLEKQDFRRLAYKNFDRNMFYPPWNKLYSLSYLKKNNILFPKTYRDDFPFVLSVIKDIDRITYTKKQYYRFMRKRSDSETQKYYAKLYEKREEENQLMIDFYNDWGLLFDIKSFEMIARRYIDRLIECMTNLYNKECTLKTNEKISEIKKYLNSEFLDRALEVAKPKKLYLKLMYVPLKLKNANLCSLMAQFINIVKGHNIKLFSVLKTNR